jgi:hypothetical protein
LVSHGHTFEQIKDYNLAQVRALLRAHERADREHKLSEAIQLRMSQAAGKDWKKYVKKLKG